MGSKQNFVDHLIRLLKTQYIYIQLYTHIAMKY